MAEDTIRREDALQALVESDVRGYEYRQLEDAIKAIPSADIPQGWVDKAISIIDEMEIEGIIAYEQAWEYRMRARMKGADDEA